MAIFKSQSTKRVVTTQGVRLNNQLFWHPENGGYHQGQVTIYYNRGYNPSVSVFSGGHFVCEAEPVELMALIDPDEEKGWRAHGRPSGSSVRSRTGWRISGNPRSGLPERHTPRRSTNSVSAWRQSRRWKRRGRAKAKQQVADKAAGRRKAASAGETRCAA